MIRAIQPADSPAIVTIAGTSGLFKPEELPAIQGMLEEYHGSGVASGQHMLGFAEGSALAGVAYFTPRPFADRVWELLMIAVAGPRQRQGIGSRLLVAVEDAVRSLDARLLLIETSDQASFERTRNFYRKHQYTLVAQIPDYFTDGDGKATFLKRISR